MEGFNATVLAYGQTGSGKTHTMLNAAQALEEEAGVTPRVLRLLYEGIHQRRTEARFRVRCQFLEIYNEEVKDLLHPETPAKAIAIREGPGGRIVVTGAKEKEMGSYEEAMRFLEVGSVSRTTGSTLMNQASSRSHAIFTIFVERRPLGALFGRGAGGGVGPGAGTGAVAKFHLVDLAGSERQKKTGAEGARFKESVTINQGLLALGNVISALGDPRKRGHTHVPYRESKLTRMLQDSLGGNSRTTMVACVSTSEDNIEETLNTLKYAHRARNIKNKPKANLTTEDGEELEAETEGTLHPLGEELLQEMQLYREVMEAECARLKREVAAGRERAAELQSECSNLAAERGFYLSALQQKEECLNGAQQAAERLQSQGALAPAAASQILEALAAAGRPVTAGPPQPGGEPSPALQAASTFMSLEGGDLSALGGTESGAAGRWQDLGAVRDELARVSTLLGEREKLLEEAQDDLARDEVIFAEKEEEMEGLHRRVEQLLAENEALKVRVSSSSAAASMGAGLMPVAVTTSPSPARGDASFHVFSPTKLDEGDDVIIEAEASAAQIEEDANMREERALLEDAHRKEIRDFQLSKQAMDRQLQDLALSIKLKEELIVDLTRNEKQARALSQQYEQRMKQLEGQVHLKEEEVAQLRQELHSIDVSIANTAEEKRRMRLAYEEKIAKITGQLSALKRQQRDQEENRVEKVRLKSEIRAKALESELGRMRIQQDTLRKKVKHSTDVHEKENERRKKELERFRKLVESKQKKVQELQSINKKQELVLRKKTEEAASAQRKLKELNAAVSGRPRSAYAGASPGGAASAKSLAGPRERGLSYSVSQQLAARGRSPSSGHTPPPAAVPGTPATPARAQRAQSARSAAPSPSPETRSWMDQTVEKMLQRREIEEQLDGLRSKRVGLLAEREKARQQRSNLELKRARAEHGLQEEVERASKEIVALDARISALRAREPGAEDGFRALKADRMAAYRRRSEIRARLDVGEVLEGEEARQLGDLDDRVDSLEAELEYLEEQTAETEGDLRGLEQASRQLQRRIAEGSLEEARGMMSSFMRSMVDIRNKERQDAARLCELELQASERAQAIERAESNLRVKDFEYERRVTELQKEHARKVQDLLSQLAVAQREPEPLVLSGSGTASPASGKEVGGPQRPDEPSRSPAAGAPTAEAAASSPVRSRGSAGEAQSLKNLVSTQQDQIRALDKDNYYYKNTNRELKRKLRELLARVDTEQEAVGLEIQETQGRNRDLEKLNESLVEELDNVRNHLRKSGAAVRVSRNELRPLTAEQVQDLRASSRVGTPAGRGAAREAGPL